MIYCQCTSEWGSLDGASVAVAKCFWLLKREQSYWSKCAASFTLNIRISSMSEVLFRRSNFAHKLILKTYLSRMYLAFFQQFRLLHFQKQTHKLLRIFEILPPSGPLWGRGYTETAANHPEQVFCIKVEQKCPLFLAIFLFFDANLLGVFRNAFNSGLPWLCNIKVSEIWPLFRAISEGEGSVRINH